MTQTSPPPTWHYYAGYYGAIIWAIMALPLILAFAGHLPTQMLLVNYAHISLDSFLTLFYSLSAMLYLYAVWQQKPAEFAFFHPAWWIATCFGLGYMARYFGTWWTKIIMILPALLAALYYTEIFSATACIMLLIAAISLKGPGTLGSIFGCILIVLCAFLPLYFTQDLPETLAKDQQQIYANYMLYGLIPITLLTVLIGTYATEIYVQRTGIKDPSEVVIDEVAGIFIATLCAIGTYALLMWLYPDAFTYYLQYFSHAYLLTLFILFRLFDIWKPYPIQIIEKWQPQGWGVMADDLLAGVYAAVVFSVLLLTMHAFNGFNFILAHI